VTARTGDVRDARRYIVLTDGRGRLAGGAGALSAASCYGARARVLTPAVGAALRVATEVPRPFSLEVLHGGRHVTGVRVRRRGRRSRTLVVRGAELPCGRLSLVLSARGVKLRLEAVKVCGRL
jgi:hypothetical protein